MDVPEAEGQAARAKALVTETNTEILNVSRCMAFVDKDKELGTCAFIFSPFVDEGQPRIITTVAEAVGFARLHIEARAAGVRPREESHDGASCPEWLARCEIPVIPKRFRHILPKKSSNGA